MKLRHYDDVAVDGMTCERCLFAEDGRMVFRRIEVYAHREIRLRDLALGFRAEHIGITAVVNIVFDDGFQLVTAKQPRLRTERTAERRLRALFADQYFELIDMVAAHFHEKLVGAELHNAEFGS